MRKTVTLDEKDIEQVVAKHFDVDPEHVYLHHEKSIEGYGTGEHTVDVVEVTISIPLDGYEKGKL